MFLEFHQQVVSVCSTAEDRDATQSPEEDRNVGAGAASDGSSHDQDVLKEPTTTSSPDTDSPVMINVDVSLRLKMLRWKDAASLTILSNYQRCHLRLFFLTVN